jgi:hypothetical protein
MIFVIWLFWLYCVSAKLPYNSYRIERASILNFIPQLKLHDIVVLSNNCNVSLASDYVDSQILAIDFTPLNQSNPQTLFKLFIGKNVPAKIRICPMEKWILKEWYYADEVEIDDRYIYLFENINKTKWEKMNLYKNNCQHFARYFIEHINS